jgi:hypothetical protein
MSSWKFFLYLFLLTPMQFHSVYIDVQATEKALITAFCGRIMQQLFMQHYAWTSVGGPAGLLHCPQHTMQKSDDCMLKHTVVSGLQQCKRFGVSYSSVHTTVCCPYAP